MSGVAETVAQIEAWDYDCAVEMAEPVLWRYLSKSAALLDGRGGHNVGEVSLADLRRLVACHLISVATRDSLVDQVEQFLKWMPASVARKRETRSGSVRGRIDWTRTVGARTAAADPTLFVCEPVDRRYDTPLGRLLKLSLHCLTQLGTQAGFRADTNSVGEGLDAQASTIARRSERLFRNPKMRQVQLVDRRLLRHLDETASRFPEVGKLIEFVDLFFRGISLGSVDALRELLNRQLFAPGLHDRLFELIVGLRLLESLEAEGYKVAEPLSVLPASGSPFAVLTKDGNLCRLWWQRSLWLVIGVSPAKGRWRRVLAENAVADPQPLMPDFVLELLDLQHVVIVEVKLSSVGSQRERDGLRDVLAYLADVEGAELALPSVQAIVVGWNATGVAQSANQKVIVTSQSRLRSDARAMLASVGTGGAP